MNTLFSKNPLKRKAYLAYHQDGIIDILIGATIIGFGLWILLDNIIFTFISWLSFGFYVQLKNAITVPRFGYVRFQETNRQTFLIFGLAIALLLFFLLMGTLFILGPDRIQLAPLTFMRKFHVQVMSGIGAFVMAIFGLVSGLRRMTFYAVVLISALLLSVNMGINGSIVLLLIGSMILLIGLALLVVFVRRNPVEPMEPNNAA